MTVRESVDARKTRLPRAAALELARGCTKIIATRGAAVTTLDPHTTDDDTLAKALLGPTGNLRAPTARLGRTLLVGLNEAALNAMQRRN